MDKAKKRWELYNSGCSDQEIAAETGYPMSTIRTWRCRKNLGRNKPQRQHDERMGYYKQGMNDLEIATVLGCKYNAIHYWRKKNNLIRNRGLSGPRCNNPEYIHNRPEEERLLVRQYATALLRHAEAYKSRYGKNPSADDIRAHMDKYQELFGACNKPAGGD